MIVGVQAIPTCFDVEQHRVNCPPEAFQVHLQSYAPLLSHPVRTDPGGRRALDTETLESGSAAGWELSPDGRTCSLRLRQGVLSAAGHEMTAHDVKWSWERAFAVNSWGARAARRCGISSPDEVRVVQPYLVQFRIQEPHPLFPAMLAGPLPPIYDLETVREHCPVGDPWGDGWLRAHTAGFGAYVLEDGADAEEAGLEGNMRYLQGAPAEKRVLLRAIPSGSARADALRRGSIDLADRLPASDVESLAAVPGVRVRQFPGCRQLLLRMDTAFAPFDQPRVRQALALAIPYEEIATEVLRGQARGVRAEEDSRGARALLREAGYGTGFRLTLHVPEGSPELEAVARLIQRHTMRLSLKVVVEPLAPAPFAREKASRHLPLYLEERGCMAPPLPPEELEPLPQVVSLLLAQPHDSFVARQEVEGFVRRPDGQPRYFELRTT